jgi:pimeloyl-ACP methyl ester carboxylesterase
MSNSTLHPLPLPAGVRSRYLKDINGLQMHLLEAGHETPGRPSLLLLHGFPELAYSWRQLMPSLAEARFHVIAPDLRGYGRTTGWQADALADPSDCNFLNLTRDLLALLAALGKTHVEAVIGHDFGAPLAAIAALARPDKFRSVVIMSAPFAGPPTWPLRSSASAPLDGFAKMLRAVEGLNSLEPPRQHYQWYYSTPQANIDMHHPPQGLHAFLRAYYHIKSADWVANQPFELGETSAQALSRLPHYYVMEAGKSMPETVAPAMPDSDAIARCAWLPDAELSVYTGEYERTGFQGGLQWYRCLTSAVQMDALRLFGELTIDVPSCFIAGASDWGIHQTPEALHKMQQQACTQMLGCHLIEGAGHWVQQEKPEAVLACLFDFFRKAGLLVSAGSTQSR